MDNLLDGVVLKGINDIDEVFFRVVYMIGDEEFVVISMRNKESVNEAVRNDIRKRREHELEAEQLQDMQ
jgi:hypothetical protein